MATHLLSKIEPQKNAITLAAAQEYTQNWQRLINELYKRDDKNMPHGIFIPMTDLAELVKLQKTITHVKRHGKEERIYIIGVRAYYCLKNVVTMPPPISALDCPVEAVLVAVFQTNPRDEGSEREYHYHKGVHTHDLIVPVPSKRDLKEAEDAGDYSIYDITQPCPNLCDKDSPLF